jgi:hypothetical protein
VLIEMKEGPDKLPHGEFEATVKKHMSPQTARKLMLIAKHPVISDRAHARDLPPSWYTLYLLTQRDLAVANATKTVANASPARPSNSLRSTTGGREEARDRQDHNLGQFGVGWQIVGIPTI